MRVVKVFCDICKKEVIDWGYRLSLGYKRLGSTSNEDKNFEDVCYKCAVKIDNFVDTIVKK